MESICAMGSKRVTLETLMVTVKQEEEEVQEESLSDSKEITLLCSKKEEGEEEGEDEGSEELLGHSPLFSANARTPKEDPDAPGGERERKKVKKRRREGKAWASMGAEGGSGGDSLWRCRLCQRCFSSSWELTGHCCPGVTGALGSPEGDVAKLEFWCPVCGDRFLRPTAFILHKRSHVGQSRYVCGVCGRTLKTLRQLAAHRRSHARGPFLPHLCQDCSCSFRSLKALRRHRAREHSEEREAVDEGANQEEEDSFVPMLPCSSPNHLPELSQNPQCTLCFMTFRDTETAERHLRFKHPAEYERQLRGRTVFACCACDRTFPSSRLLSAHQRTHSKWSLSSLGSEGSLQDRRRDGVVQEGQTDGKTKHLTCNGSKFDRGGAGSMRCRHCHIIFADPRTWGRHMTAKHPPPPTSVQATPGCFSLRPPRGQPRPYSCSTCGEKFIEESSLMKHHTESHAS